PWLTRLGEGESTWRFDPKGAGAGLLADAGDHLVDALLWTTDQIAGEVAAFQSPWDPGVNLVTAAPIRLPAGPPVPLGNFRHLARGAVRPGLSRRARPTPGDRPNLGGSWAKIGGRCRDLVRAQRASEWILGLIHSLARRACKNGVHVSGPMSHLGKRS